MDQRRGQRRGAALHRLRPAPDPGRTQAAQDRLPPPLRQAEEDQGGVRKALSQSPRTAMPRGGSFAIWRLPVPLSEKRLLVSGIKACYTEINSSINRNLKR